MKPIAAQAGVSEKTMYLTYETKATLLRHVIQVAVRGDEDPAPSRGGPNGAPSSTGRQIRRSHDSPHSTPR